MGERIRRLPSITPPESMRAAVFAAIAADRHQVAPAVVELSRVATDPAIPVVRLTRRPRQRAPLQLGVRAALIAAAVMLTFVAARFMPGISALSRIASSFSLAPTTTSNQSHARRSLSSAQHTYTAPGLLSVETPAMATDAWLVYVAGSGTDTTLYIQDRRGQTLTALFTGDASQLISLQALTDDWVLWTLGSETSGPWTLSARNLSAQSSGATVTLASSGTEGLSSLTGVWARGDTALITGETADGTGEVLRIDLTTGKATLLASAAGHFYTNPTAGAGVSYWSDVTFDTLRGLRGTIEQLRDGGQVSLVAADYHRFAPLMAGDSLAWVSVADARLATAASGFSSLTAESGAAMLYQLTGAVEIAGSEIGTGETALAPYLAAGGNLIVWRTSGGWHCYDVNGKAPVDGLAGASDVALTDTAIVWSDGAGSTTLYVAPTN